MGERRLDSYYFGFVSSGADEVDAVLEAVRDAGKWSHSTEMWSDPKDGKNGPTCADNIQTAANECAKALAASQATVLAMKTALVRWAAASDDARRANLLLGMRDDTADREYRDASDALMRVARNTPPGSDAALRNICERCATDALSIWREDGVGEIAAVDEAVRRNLGAERAEGSET